MVNLFDYNSKILNLQAINNNIDKNKLATFRKNICRSKNKNINYKENINPSIKNTVIFITLSELNKCKIIILKQLLSSKYNIVIGFDTKYYKNKNEVNKEICTFKDFIETELKMKVNLFINIQKIELNNDVNMKKYGHKIANFNGKWTNNPSKFGALSWFYSTKYEYMWNIEDDVYSKDYDTFFNDYNNNNDDLICTISENHLPPWFYDNWRVGSVDHGFDLAYLFIVRYSKQFCNRFFNYIKITTLTSHHEIFIPYILNYYHLKHKNINSYHKKYLHLNNHKNSMIFNESNIDTLDSIIFHPFKL